jgi:hypothetical protein
MSTPKTKVNLAKLFGNVASELAKNQSALNQADTQNNDHGTNMVNVFNTITSAMEEKPKASPSSQLEYAAQQVKQNCQTGSGNVYADGLARAAETLQGQNITSDNAMQLITALLGSNLGSQAPAQPSGADALGSLLGSVLGGASPTTSSGGGSADTLGSLLGDVLEGGQTANTPAGGASGDALSSLLGGLLGGEQASSGTSSSAAAGIGGTGITLDQVLAAGMGFMQAKNQGKDTMSSLLNAMVAGSQAGSGYRADSGKLVAGTLMQGLGSLLNQK